MMHATLMNFGDNTRVVNDMNNAAVSIGIGQIVETDIHDVHFHMIRRSVATETLLVVPKDVKQTPRLQTIMQLLRSIETEPYDELLALYRTVVEQGEQLTLRPVRNEMRLQLLDHARREVAVALRLQSKVNIHEEGDRVTRQQPDPKTVVVPSTETQEPKRVESPDRKDKAPRKAGARSSAKKRDPAPKSLKPKVKRERL